MQHKNVVVTIGYYTLSAVLIGFNMINAMDTPTLNESPKSGKKCNYTDHARKMMSDREISRQDVQQVLAKNKRFLDKMHPDSIVYRGISRKNPISVVTSKGVNKNGEITIITVYRQELKCRAPKKLESKQQGRRKGRQQKKRNLIQDYTNPF